MTRIHFGHCIGCDQPIRPPYLSFAVSMSKAPDGVALDQWEDVDVCNDCSVKLTADDLHRLVSTEDAAA